MTWPSFDSVSTDSHVTPASAVLASAPALASPVADGSVPQAARQTTARRRTSRLSATAAPTPNRLESRLRSRAPVGLLSPEGASVCGDVVAPTPHVPAAVRKTARDPGGAPTRRHDRVALSAAAQRHDHRSRRRDRRYLLRAGARRVHARPRRTADRMLDHGRLLSDPRSLPLRPPL